MSEQIDIEQIMDEIRREAKELTEQGLLPDFEQISEKEPVVYDWAVSCAYPVTQGSALKKCYTRIVSKLVRCVLFPITERITQVNQEMKIRMDEMDRIITKQQGEILELRRRVKRLTRETEDRA